MTDLVTRRRAYAEELRTVARLRSEALVEAFARVPREHFLGPGPWQIVVRAALDHVEVRDVKTDDIAEDKKRSVKILFDPGHSLAERVLNEQFKF